LNAATVSKSLSGTLKSESAAAAIGAAQATVTVTGPGPLKGWFKFKFPAMTCGPVLATVLD
jgi:hypothetical protein